MCKILCYTSHDPAKRDEIIAKVWGHMSISEKDGYGAAWFSPDGQIGYHKRRYPKISLDAVPPFVQQKNIKSPESFGESNDIPSDGGFLIIHGRTATNPINIANTHPFIDTLDDGRRVALIHNGVVKSDKYSNLLHGCTCDSELLLRAYTDNGIDSVQRHVDGRFAFMYLQYDPPTPEEIELARAEGRDPVGKKSLHVAKDRVANLHFGTMPDDTYVLGTTEYLLKDVGAFHEGELKDNMLLVFTDKTEYEMEEFKPIPWFDRQPKQPAQNVLPPIQQHQHRQSTHESYPPKVATTLDAEILEIEKQEIEQLEREAIEAYAG